MTDVPVPSPLAEADPNSLDELWARIDAKLVAGLPQDITDPDIDAVVARLWARRDAFAQQQMEAALKPKRGAGTGGSSRAKKPSIATIIELTL